MVSIESCFDLDLLEHKSLDGILTSRLTAFVCKYKDFDTVLRCADDLYSDTELIAGVCDITEQETLRQLLYKDIISVLNHFDYWQPAEVKEQYIDIYNAYIDCLVPKYNI